MVNYSYKQERTPTESKKKIKIRKQSSICCKRERTLAKYRPVVKLHQWLIGQFKMNSVISGVLYVVRVQHIWQIKLTLIWHWRWLLMPPRTLDNQQQSSKRGFSRRRKHARVKITEEWNTSFHIGWWIWWMWHAGGGGGGGLLALVYTTATNKISLNFLIGLARLIRPPCRVQMVTVTEWNQHPAKIWLGGDLGPVSRLWWKELVEPVMNELRVSLSPLISHQ